MNFFNNFGELLYIEGIDESVHIANEFGNFHGASAFKCEPAVVTGFLDRFKNLGIVEFAGTGLISAGVIADVEVTEIGRAHV